MELVGVTASPPPVIRITRGAESTELRFRDDYIAFSNTPEAEIRVDSEIVFVGYGITAPEYGWDDYKGRGRAGQGPARHEQRSGGRPRALCRQDPPLLRPLGLQVRPRGPPRRRRGHHHPYDGLGRLQMAGRPDLVDGRAVQPARGGGPAVAAGEGLGHRGGVPAPRRPGGPRPGCPSRRRPEEGFPARAPRRPGQPDPRQRGAAQADRERHRPARGERQRAGRGGGALHGPPRSPRGEGGRPARPGHDLQRRARQRFRGRDPARDRRGHEGSAPAAPADDPLRRRGRGRAGPPGLRVPRPQSADPAGEDRGQHQHGRHEHLGPHAGRGGDRPRQVEPRRLGARPWRRPRAGPSCPTSSPTEARSTVPTS